MKHVGWPQLPRLAAHLMVVQAQLAQYHNLASLSSFDEPTEVVHRLWNTVEAMNPSECRTEPVLHDYFERIWNSVELNYSNALADMHSGRLRSSIETAFKSNPCFACDPNHVCSGTRQSRYADDDTVHNHGHCLTLLKDLYEYALDLSDAWYAQYAGLSRRATFMFCTGQIGERNESLDISLTGEAYEADREVGRVIKLTLAIEYYRLEDYFSTLYVLFHECFAHGWCGCELKSSMSDVSDRFHEGWMDWVGVELLRKHLAACAECQNPRIKQCASDFRKRAERVSELRKDHLRSKPCKSAAQTATGAEAAEKFWKFSSAVCGSRSHGYDLLYRFSLRLNASTYPDEKRAQLVTRINLLFAQADFHQVFIDYPALIAAADQFRHDGNAETLADTVLNQPLLSEEGL